jgi:hypothetical protein
VNDIQASEPYGSRECDVLSALEGGADMRSCPATSAFGNFSDMPGRSGDVCFWHEGT